MTTLVNDLSIICGDEQWHTVLGVSITCIAVYVVGIMSFLCYIISVAPMHFHEPTFLSVGNFYSSSKFLVLPRLAEAASLHFETLRLAKAASHKRPPAIAKGRRVKLRDRDPW